VERSPETRAARKDEMIMIWVFYAVQMVLIAFTVWSYDERIIEKFDSLLSSWHPEISGALFLSPLISIAALVMAAFFIINYAWVFLLFTIIWFVFCIYVTTEFPQPMSMPKEEVRDHLSAVMKMYDLRRSVDARLKKEKNAEYTPICWLFETPEALIANAVELSEMLQDDGHTEEESIKKLLLSLNQPMPADDCTDIMSYLRFRLNAVDPEYLTLGQNILSQAVAIAKVGAKFEIEERKAIYDKDKEIPSGKYLEKFSYNDVVNDFVHSDQAERKKRLYYSYSPFGYEEKKDWMRFQLRMKQDDELWGFGSDCTIIDSVCFTRISGFVLIRQGYRIDHIANDIPFITRGASA
jgi:hypothetical protein